jgi:alginate O-acetyltransferase complex protein AlgJ
VHQAGSGVELWAKVEFQPWFTPFAGSADQDGDGFPELYGRVAPSAVTKELTAAIQKDYQEPLLSPAEVKAWANQLSSYWYPSFNTDLIPTGPTWPDQQTEANIKSELGGRSFDAPTIVLRGKPQGKPTYNVFLVRGAGEPPREAAAAKPVHVWSKTRPSPTPALAADLCPTRAAGTRRWVLVEVDGEAGPMHDALRKRLKAMPPKPRRWLARTASSSIEIALNTWRAAISRSSARARTRCR